MTARGEFSSVLVSNFSGKNSKEGWISLFNPAHKSYNLFIKFTPEPSTLKNLRVEYTPDCSQTTRVMIAVRNYSFWGVKPALKEQNSRTLLISPQILRGEINSVVKCS